jgi:hypothetical protein
LHCIYYFFSKNLILICSRENLVARAEFFFFSREKKKFTW